MAKKKAKLDKKVRMQIPVSEEIVKAIDKQAKECDRSQAWVVITFLNMSLIEMEFLGNWMRRRVIGKGEVKKMGWRQTKGESSYRIQVLVKDSLEQHINELASRLNNSPAKVAALLLDYSLDAHSTMTYWQNRQPFRAFLDWLFGKAYDHPDFATIEPNEVIVSEEFSIEQMDEEKIEEMSEW